MPDASSIDEWASGFAGAQAQNEDSKGVYLILLRETQTHEQGLFVFRPWHVLTEAGVQVVQVAFTALLRDATRDVAGKVGPL